MTYTKQKPAYKSRLLGSIVKINNNFIQTPSEHYGDEYMNVFVKENNPLFPIYDEWINQTVENPWFLN